MNGHGAWGGVQSSPESFGQSTAIGICQRHGYAAYGKSTELKERRRL